MDEKKANDLKPLIEKESILKSHLEVMQRDSSECIRKARVDVNTGEEFFTAQVGYLVGVLQERCVERIIEDTFDRYHKRVYSILRNRGFLDENEIVKQCFMPPREVRKLINHLFQGKLCYLNL